MTLTELADQIGMALANLSILKTGKARAIRFSTLDAICEALVIWDAGARYIMVLLGSIMGTLAPLAHMMRAGRVGGRIVNSSGILFWVWTLLTLQVTAVFSLVLSVLGLWNLSWRRGLSNAEQHSAFVSETK